jgi:hypothetical protein
MADRGSNIAVLRSHHLAACDSDIRTLDARMHVRTAGADPSCDRAAGLPHADVLRVRRHIPGRHRQLHLNRQWCVVLI